MTKAPILLYDLFCASNIVAVDGVDGDFKLSEMGVWELSSLGMTYSFHDQPVKFEADGAVKLHLAPFDSFRTMRMPERQVVLRFFMVVPVNADTLVHTWPMMPAANRHRTLYDKFAWLKMRAIRQGLDKG